MRRVPSQPPYGMPRAEHYGGDDDEASSASSSSDAGHGEKRPRPYRDVEDDDDDDDDDETANGGKDVGGSSPHSYPPKQSTKGDDEDEGKLSLDEEERVGLMQRDRDKATSGTWRSRSSKGPIMHRFGRYLVVGSVFASVLLLVPLLGWLATSTSGGARHPAYVEQVSALDSWELPANNDGSDPYSSEHRHGSHPHKSKHPLPPGTSKLLPAASNDERGAYALGKGNGRPFAVNYQLPGLSDASRIMSVSQKGNSSRLKRITMDNVFDGTFAAAQEDLDWSAEDPDEGVFVKTDIVGNLIVQDVTSLQKEKTGEGEVAKGGGKVTFVRRSDVKDENGRTLSWHSFKLSPDMRYVLFFTDRVKQWRYSSYSKVWIHNVQAKETTQIGFNQSRASVSIASWAPAEKNSEWPSVVFVEDNNLFYINNVDKPKEVLNITSDGAKTVFNGINDWVYEEEIFGDDAALWWSPDGKKIVYLRFDETDVPVYSLPIYNPSADAGKETAYPTNTEIKYPKPGFPNPIVSAHMVDLTTVKTASNGSINVEDIKAELVSPRDSTSVTDDINEQAADVALRSAGTAKRIINSITWVSNDEVLVRETNRISDAMRVVRFNVKNVTLAQDNVPAWQQSKDKKLRQVVGETVRRHSTVQQGGWIAPDQEVVALHDVKRPASSPTTAYVDVIDFDGFRHLAWFANASSSVPVYLTAGEWEIDRVVHVDVQRLRAYFLAALPDPSQRHLFYVDIPKSASEATKAPWKQPIALTDMSKPGSYDASFDPKGSYYVLHYKGPDIPHSKVLSVSDGSFDLVLTDNDKLRKNVKEHVRPAKVYYNVTTSAGITVSVEETRPHDFDASGTVQYPVLFNVYGGPNSQVVRGEWKMADWHTYLACTLGYIVVRVDGRGTGFRGRPYRDVVTWNLGNFESKDVVDAAEAIRRLPHVAHEKVGIWGWSYGGYLTSKVVERDSGTFDLGMAVAPVAKWSLYDSIYTERYMKTPKLNAGGYRNSSVHITDGFRHSHYLLAQGSGDDNVHFSNSATLLDLLTAERVRDFWFRMFTDSNHSINTRGANRELYEYLTRFLVTKWGAGPHRVFKSV